jgi:catechol 2,3-dioxygenase-like lactoylglutathione lyase family enzyme
MSHDGPIQMINAVTLVVADMARSVGFYTALGFRLRYGGADAAFTSLRAGDGFLNLQPGAPPVWPDGAVWGRVIIWVDDVDAQHQRCVDAGFEPSMPPSDAPWGERYFHILDPDGHELSFAKLL